MTTADWIQLVSVITNVSIIAVGIKLIRHISRMEMKVDLMWMVFVRRFGTRDTDKEIDLGDLNEA